MERGCLKRDCFSTAPFSYIDGRVGRLIRLLRCAVILRSLAISPVMRYTRFMNAIITVVGSDKVGIIAKVSGFLAEHKVNIADISQTILSGNFVMMMMVNLDGADISIENLRAEMDKTADAMGVEINIMSEKVFSAMHRI